LNAKNINLPVFKYYPTLQSLSKKTQLTLELITTAFVLISELS